MKEKTHIVLTKEEKIKKNAYKALVILGIANYIYHFFIEKETIGHDRRYTIFIFLLPTIIGIILLGFYRKVSFLTAYTKCKGTAAKLVTVIIWLLEGFFFSYLSLGFLANITWDQFNKMAAAQSPTQIIIGKNLQFVTSYGRRHNRSYHINFTCYGEHEGEHEQVRCDNETINNFNGKDPGNYEILLTVSKGIWNYYVIDDYSIVDTSK